MAQTPAARVWSLQSHRGLQLHTLTYVYECFVCLYGCVPHACTPEESQISWNWSHGCSFVSCCVVLWNQVRAQEQLVTTEPSLQPPSTLVTGTLMFQMTQTLQRKGLGWLVLHTVLLSTTKTPGSLPVPQKDERRRKKCDKALTPEEVDGNSLYSLPSWKLCNYVKTAQS